MFTSNILFWNVDTQIDFMNKTGKLYAPGAEKIKPVLQQITSFALDNNIQVVNTSDYHYENSAELSKSPDFVNSFPEHCMANTKGADYISETKPRAPFYEIKWDSKYSEKDLKIAISHRNIVIRKDAFDVFAGNNNTDNLLHQLEIDKIFVYGVTTNVCVNCAVLGLQQRNANVYVIEDAIKELPNIPLPYENWDKLGVKRILFDEIDQYI